MIHEKLNSVLIKEASQINVKGKKYLTRSSKKKITLYHKLKIKSNKGKLYIGLTYLTIYNIKLFRQISKRQMKIFITNIPEC